jgi:hypothetical protein
MTTSSEPAESEPTGTEPPGTEPPGTDPPGTEPDVLDLPPSGSALESGTYTRRGFLPSITFAVDDGWHAGTVGDEFFDIQLRPGTPDVVAVQFGIVHAAIGADGRVIDAESAASVVAAIGANPGLVVLGESESRLGGQRGLNVEVENRSGGHSAILDVAPGRLGIDDGRSLWVSVFDTSAGVLAVMVGGPSDGWDGALLAAEPILESVVVDD